MRAVLVTGASGFVGRALCQHLEAHGIHVRRALRRAPAGHIGDHVVVGEIGPHTDWREALVGVDVVAHLAARVHVMQDSAPDPAAEYRKVNVEGTRALAMTAGRAGVRRFLLLSSVKVNGEATPYPYTEDHAPKPDDLYAISKLEAEQVLQEVAAKAGMEWTIVRPPLVYGPGVGANFLRLVQAVARRRPLPIAAVANLRSVVYVGNLVDAIRICLEHPDAANQTFLVRDGEDVSTPDLARRVARALGVSPILLPVPVRVLHLLGRLLGREATVRRLAGSLQVDDARLRAKVEWHPPYSLDEGLQATAQWYKGLDRRARAGATA
jgi:nucleoside-diphosphate-sugar epimerase